MRLRRTAARYEPLWADRWIRCVSWERPPAAKASRPLDGGASPPHPFGQVSRPDGRPGKGRKTAGEESPGSLDMRCRITSGGGNPRESATENRPPASATATAGKGETVR